MPACTSRRRSGGNPVSTAQEFVEGQDFARQRQQISAYIEGFLQRERTGPEQLEELTSTTLYKLCGGDEDCNVAAAEGIDRSAEPRCRIARVAKRRPRRPGGALQRSHRPARSACLRRRLPISSMPRACMTWERFSCPEHILNRTGVADRRGILPGEDACRMSVRRL